MNFLEHLHQRYPHHTLPETVTDLVLDSRQVTPGSVFVALEGHFQDGWNFAPQAVAAGAVLILTNCRNWHEDIGVPVIHDATLVEVLPALAAEFYQDPCKQLRIIGITGTNGKTSVAQFCTQLIILSGHTCGYIGTNGYGQLGKLKGLINTTPDTVKLHQVLAEMVDENIEFCAMEVSSHGLDQGRIDALRFEATCFTNLSRDHLDYHITLEAYAEAKYRLLSSFDSNTKVINADDACGLEFIARLSGQPGVVTYGLNNDQGALDITATQVACLDSGVSFRLVVGTQQADVTMPLFGTFNISNILAAVGLVLSVGISFDAVVKSLSLIQPVAGRMQFMPNNENKAIAVDYAHTPDALEKALSAMRAHCDGKLWVLFGCGGDRDKGKRPLMAAIAERLADSIVVTDDNPRTESSESIMDDIGTGFTPAVQPHVMYVSDRAEAITYVLAHSGPGDAILIAGKGHESYQVVGTVSHPFSDQAVIRQCLEVTV